MTANVPTNLALFAGDVLRAAKGGEWWANRHPGTDWTDAFAYWLRGDMATCEGFAERIDSEGRWNALKDAFGQAWLRESARRLQAAATA